MAENAEFMKLPALFRERLASIVPPSAFTRIAETFTRPSMTGFRINNLKSNPALIHDQLTGLSIPIQAVPWFADAYLVSASDREALIESSLYQQDCLYLQNLSSMIPPIVLAPEPWERVLDLAAAPGSKTLQMADAMQLKGELIATELVRKRYYQMLDNLKRHGADWVNVLNHNGENLWKRYPGYFDKVLLDAPCSTEGRFKTYDPETWKYWSLRKIKEMVRKQSRLLFSGIKALRVDGILVYSTCSFAPEENEGVIQRMLDKFGTALEIVPVVWEGSNIQSGLAGWKGKSFNPEIARSLRILPTESMEAFFICKIRKRDATIT